MNLDRTTGDPEEIDEFFRRGDDGDYEGGPSERPVTLEDRSDASDVLHSERHRARRARYTPFVATLIAVLGVGSIAVFAREAFIRRPSLEATLASTPPMVRVQSAKAALPASEPLLMQSAADCGKASGVLLESLASSAPVPTKCELLEEKNPVSSHRPSKPRAPKVPQLWLEHAKAETQTATPAADAGAVADAATLEAEPRDLEAMTPAELEAVTPAADAEVAADLDPPPPDLEAAAPPAASNASPPGPSAHLSGRPPSERFGD